jgi:hypothetical protein
MAAGDERQCGRWWRRGRRGEGFELPCERRVRLRLGVECLEGRVWWEATTAGDERRRRGRWWRRGQRRRRVLAAVRASVPVGEWCLVGVGCLESSIYQRERRRRETSAEAEDGRGEEYKLRCGRRVPWEAGIRAGAGEGAGLWTWGALKAGYQRDSDGGRRAPAREMVEVRAGEAKGMCGRRCLVGVSAGGRRVP